MVSNNAKQRIQQLIEQLPDDCSFDEIQHHLHVAELLRRRIAKADAPDAEFLTTDQLRERLAKWST
ncbi:MAG: hypothetical protein AAGA29_08800 [Planctomycetota bacterium]